MKKFTSLLIGCSLALVGAALAQQPDEQQSPPTKKQGTGKTQTAEAQPGATTANPEATVAKQPRGAKHERNASKGQKVEATPKSAASAGAQTNVSGEPAASATPGGKHQAGQRGQGRNARGANAKTSPSATPVTAASASATPATAASSATPATAATASAAPTVAAGGQQNAQANTGVKAKKPDQQQVQQIKQQHTNFKAQPKPDKVPAVTFNQSYRIQGSDRWQGPQYEVFRSYHPERHDQGWYRSHYNRVELIGGGYYYWNNNYWYPAWGYSPSAEYYAYDGPIYVGHRAEPPDRVIADVQAELQQMGYYKGEVDGLLGPLTREALTAYQADEGLTTTAVIDEPTLDSLGMG
jgi:Putative peptidoglycan binding domain